MSGADADRRQEPYVPDFVVEDLRKRFKAFPPPEQRTFNPSDRSTQELLDLGLPPKPDPERQPLLRQLWDRAFAREVTVVPFEFREDLLQAIRYRMLNRHVDEMPIEETRVESSSNWSGAYITANRDRQLMQIWGVWTAPEHLDLPLAPYQGPPDLPYVCSNWIGLDGQRLYLDSSLPQMGTASTRQDVGPPITEAWTQWWARGNTGTVPLPMPLTVAPGDEVLSVLTALDPQTVVFLMVNLTSGEFMPVTGTAPPVTLPDMSIVFPSISGVTAEWIVERPRIVHSTKQCNFPDYHTSDFSYCGAIEASEVNITALLGGVEQELRGERLIRMFEVLPDPVRTEHISMAWKSSATSVHLKYGDFF